MTNTTFQFLVLHRGNAVANQLAHALNDHDSAWLYDELNQVEGGIPDPERSPALDSWKTEWSAEDLIEYARTGVIPMKFRKAS
jgi:hypothetical protein